MSKANTSTASAVTQQFAARIVRLREAREWSVKTAAAEIEISYWRLKKYEEGKREPPLWLLVKIADVYQVSVSFLVRGANDVIEFPKPPKRIGSPG